MKLRRILLTSFLSLMPLTLTHADNSNSNPDQPINETPTPPTEVLKFNVQFVTQSCTISEGFKMCSSNGLPTPNDKPRGEEIIELKFSSSACVQPGGGISKRPIREKFIALDDQNEESCTYHHQGYWIDMYQNLSKRYIGVVTVYKSSPKDSISSSPWYSIEVEVLGKTRTLAKMTGGFSSWDQLQAVALLIDEKEEGDMVTTTTLRIGPSLFPNSYEKLKANSANLPPIQWNVIRGKLLP